MIEWSRNVVPIHDTGCRLAADDYWFNAGPILPILNPILSTDMTAIAIFYRPAIGFVIASDGYGESVAGKTRNDVQKIFPIPGLAMAYGTAGFCFNDRKTFDLGVECRNAALSLQDRNCANIQEYGERFAQIINTAFETGRHEGRIDSFPSNFGDLVLPNVLSVVLLAGYYQGQASVGQIMFRHNNQVLQEPTGVFSTDLPVGDACTGVGSQPIMRLIGQQGHWVQDYAKPVASDCSSVDELVSLSKGYIAACSDPRAVSIDPSCKRIGGHIHVASVTSDGFDWLIPPLISN